MSDLKVVSTSYMQLEFTNSINFLCLKEGIKQFGHLCNWELGSVSSLEVKIIKEPRRRQLLETKLKIVSTGVHLTVVHMSYPIWRLFTIIVYVRTEVLNEKVCMRLTQSGLKLSESLFGQKEPKQPQFFWGKIEHYAGSVTKLQPPKFGHAQRAKFCFLFLPSPCVLVGNVFAKIPKVLKLFQKKYGQLVENTFLCGIFFDFTWFLLFSLVCLTILCSLWHVFPCTSQGSIA